eukprot:6202405-Amphidinium_carterae.1
MRGLVFELLEAGGRSPAAYASVAGDRYGGYEEPSGQPSGWLNPGRNRGDPARTEERKQDRSAQRAASRQAEWQWHSAGSDGYPQSSWTQWQDWSNWQPTQQDWGNWQPTQQRKRSKSTKRRPSERKNPRTAYDGVADSKPGNSGLDLGQVSIQGDRISAPLGTLGYLDPGAVEALRRGESTR